MTFLHYVVAFCHLNLHFYVSFTLVCFEPPQANIQDDTAEKFLDQVLATAIVCRQHLTNKIPTKWLPMNNEGNTTMPPTAPSEPNHSGQQIKKSATTIIWQMNIEVQLTMHATWITASMPFCLISGIIHVR